MNPEELLLSEDNWKLVVTFLPSGWREKARESGALTRARRFRDEETLLRVLLMHIAGGDSLRVTSAKAKQSGLANVSDVAILKRLIKSGEWLRWLAENIRKEWLPQQPQQITNSNFAVRVFDGSTIQEPGATGSTWRLHYSINLNTLSCDEVHLTSPKKGEALWRFSIGENEVAIADRGYCGRPGLRYIIENSGHFIVRFNTIMPLLDVEGNEFDPLEHAKNLSIAEPAAWRVQFEANGKMYPARLCAIKRSNAAVIKEISKIKKESSKKQRKTKEKTLDAAKYIFVLTSLDESYPPSMILEYYRYRWQIELVFKRLKSIIGLGHLKKYDEQGSKAWLNGKLLVAFLIEIIRDAGSAFFPWGYKIPAEKQ